jgi:hypothetical protein
VHIEAQPEGGLGVSVVFPVRQRQEEQPGDAG